MFKKLFLVLVLCLALTGAAYADDLFNSAGPLTLLSAQTSTGNGSVVALGFTTTKITCHITYGGTAPTTVTVSLLGSINNVTYGTLTIGSASTFVYTIADATSNSFSVMYQPVKYLKGNYVSKTGGDGTTAITMICGVGGN
jgi:hypothetical protein